MLTDFASRSAVYRVSLKKTILGLLGKPIFQQLWLKTPSVFGSPKRIE
jgi:hypothetical protein